MGTDPAPRRDVVGAGDVTRPTRRAPRPEGGARQSREVPDSLGKCGLLLRFRALAAVEPFVPDEAFLTGKYGS